MIRKHTRTPGGRTLLGAAAAIGSFLVATTATAQERFWVDAAASAPVALNAPYTSDYGQGFSGALGGYGSLAPKLSLGGRIGAGFLDDDDNVHPATGKLTFGTLSAALRIRPLGTRNSAERSTGLWLEAAGGGALLEDQVRPAIEPGLGYNFSTDYVGIGPFGRYTQIIETEDQFGGKDARLVMVGLELTLLDRHDRVMRGLEQPMMDRHRQAELEMDRREVIAERERMRQRDAELQKERAALDARRQELEQREEAARRDEAERREAIQRVAGEEPGALVLDERLFFEYNSAELRAEGKRKLDAIADDFKRNRPTWQVIRVQGNADQRGSEQYNLRLSGRRAMAARNYLVSRGIPTDSIKAEAYGKDWPRVEGASSESEFQENRNVAFVIVLGNKETKEVSEVKPPAKQLEEQRRVPVSGKEEGQRVLTPGREEEKTK